MGLVMIVFLGIMQKENIQIEWLVFSILAGLLVGALSHYLIAKVLGPLVFARLSCADGAVRSALNWAAAGRRVFVTLLPLACPATVPGPRSTERFGRPPTMS